MDTGLVSSFGLPTDTIVSFVSSFLPEQHGLAGAGMCLGCLLRERERERSTCWAWSGHFTVLVITLLVFFWRAAYAGKYACT